MFRSIAIVAALSVASVAAAQTLADPQITPDALRQVRSFEDTLRKAIVTAGGQVGDRARAVVPDVKLRFEADPYVKGIILPTGEGIVFTVEVPGIEATSVMMYEQMARILQQQQNQGFMGVGNPRTGPPTTPAPPPPPIGSPLDPAAAYQEFTRQALIDAILDSAFTLPLKEGQSLTVTAGTLDPNPDQLGPILRRLYLTIKADDLMALRQNRITRDEARTRIIEKRY